MAKIKCSECGQSTEQVFTDQYLTDNKKFIDTLELNDHLIISPGEKLCKACAYKRTGFKNVERLINMEKLDSQKGNTEN